jgi:formylglycine-generating enzyme required for sulfatase activity
MDQKTVFISYRRTISKHLARAIYMDLKMHGWDVFLDVNTIDSGDFDRIILNQIGARAHFVLLISPGSLERCANPGDWVLREIQEAVRLGRNIVPIIEEGADFDREMGYLPDDLRAVIRRKNGLPLPHFFFDAAVEMLRNRFLKTPEYVQITDAPATDRSEVQRRIAQAEADSPLPAQRSGEGPGISADELALTRARRFRGQRNSDWEPYITTFPHLKIPDMPFCLVPVGAFNMGSDDGRDNEKPVHPQRIEQPYWIAQFPVTNAHWAAAVRAGVVKEPGRSTALQWYHDPALTDAPVVGVNWFMARDFAIWLGCRLPSELEWEYAARGVESLRYPWGDAWQPDNAVWKENSGGKPAVVTTKPEGKSWVAARHMSGNVWEWTRSLYKNYPYRAEDGRERDAINSSNITFVLRGGSFFNVQYGAACAFRNSDDPDLDDDYYGLRLVVGAPY